MLKKLRRYRLRKRIDEIRREAGTMPIDFSQKHRDLAEMPTPRRNYKKMPETLFRAMLQNLKLVEG